MPQNVVNFLFIVNLLSKKRMELMKSINTSFTNLVRRDLARERKNCECYIMPHTDLFTLMS